MVLVIVHADPMQVDSSLLRRFWTEHVLARAPWVRSCGYVRALITLRRVVLVVLRCKYVTGKFSFYCDQWSYLYDRKGSYLVELDRYKIE